MARSVTITTPVPTADEMAKRLGVGKRRLAIIKKIVRNSSNGSAGHRESESVGREAAGREEAAS